MSNAVAVLQQELTIIVTIRRVHQCDLKPNRLSHDGFQECQLPYLIGIVNKKTKKRRTLSQGMLYSFGDSASHVPQRKRAQELWINKNGPWGIDASDEIFPQEMVDRLAKIN